MNGLNQEVSILQDEIDIKEITHDITLESLRLESLHDNITYAIRDVSLIDLPQNDMSLESFSLKDIIKRIIDAIVRTWTKLTRMIRSFFNRIQLNHGKLHNQLKATNRICSTMMQYDITSGSQEFEHYNPKLRLGTRWDSEKTIDSVKENIDFIQESRDIYIEYYKRLINESIDLLGNVNKLKDFDKYAKTRTIKSLILDLNKSLRESFPRNRHLQILPGGQRIVFEDADEKGTFVRLSVSPHPRARDYRKQTIPVPTLSLIESYILTGMQCMININDVDNKVSELNERINRIERDLRLNYISDEDISEDEQREALEKIRYIFSDRYINDVNKTVLYEYELLRGIVHFVKESLKQYENSGSWLDLLKRKNARTSQDFLQEFKLI